MELVYDYQSHSLKYIQKGTRTVAQLPTSSMTVKQRLSILNHFLLPSPVLSAYLNESNTNRIQEFRKAFQDMSHGKRDIDFNSLSTLLDNVEKERIFRVR